MPALSAAEIPASPAASFLATSSGILPAAMPPAARQSSNPGYVGLGRGSACLLRTEYFGTYF